MIQSFLQGEPKFVNKPIEISSATSLSLPETLSPPSTPSTGQTPTATFTLIFPTNLDHRYRELLTTNILLSSDWNTIVAPRPLFVQHLHSNRLHKILHDIHKDLQEHSVQILK